MAFVRKNNTGSLFKNLDKEAGNPAHENWADYNGSIQVDGVDYWLNAWVKDGAKGKFMSVTVKPQKAPDANTKSAQAPKAKPKNDFDSDDIPF